MPLETQGPWRGRDRLRHVHVDPADAVRVVPSRAGRAVAGRTSGVGRRVEAADEVGPVGPRGGAAFEFAQGRVVGGGGPQ